MIGRRNARWQPWNKGKEQRENVSASEKSTFLAEEKPIVGELGSLAGATLSNSRENPSESRDRHVQTSQSFFVLPALGGLLATNHEGAFRSPQSNYLQSNI